MAATTVETMTRGGTEALRPCPLCAGGEVRTYTHLKQFRILGCRACGMHYLHPRSFEHPGELYDAYYDDDDRGSWWQWEEGSAAQFRWIVEQIRRRVEAGRVLDVGCGGGYFLELCRHAGYEVDGCELARTGAERAAARLGIPIARRPIEELEIPAGSLDVVSLNNVLEHVADPAATLAVLHRALRPGGLITVTVPNLVFGRLVRAALRPLEWLGRPNPAYGVSVFHVPGHLSFFSPRTLTRMLEQAGFGDVELYNEVPIRNEGARLKNAAKWTQHAIARGVRALTGGRLLIGHGLTGFARKPMTGGTAAGAA